MSRLSPLLRCVLVVALLGLGLSPAGASAHSTLQSSSTAALGAARASQYGAIALGIGTLVFLVACWLPAGAPRELLIVSSLMALASA